MKIFVDDGFNGCRGWGWNIRTAMRCIELGKKYVDVYICLDERNPANIYQRGLVNPDNFELFFSELYGAFVTNPKLGNVYLFHQREAMIAQLQEAAYKDKDNVEPISDYLSILKHSAGDSRLVKFINKVKRKALSKAVFRRMIPNALKEKVHNLTNEDVLNNYFIKYVYSHETINNFAAKNGYIPFLQASLGCAPDIDELIARHFKGKKIVPFHLRLRRLDVGYGGDHTYDRDSDFLEWYDFLNKASKKYPHVQFVALGRLQEKPLEILRLPNVTSLRVFGMGLGHELTLMLRSDLFIGSSSGFAALANFSSLPYFITHMNIGSCHAYAIEEGAEQLPFAQENQKLIYEPETSVLLMKLLKMGLGLDEQSTPLEDVNAEQSQTINVNEWLKSHANPANKARTTCRFYLNEKYCQEETAYLLLPYFEQAKQAFANEEDDKAKAILLKLKNNFPNLCDQFQEYSQKELQSQIEQFNFAEVSS